MPRQAQGGTARPNLSYFPHVPPPQHDCQAQGPTVASVNPFLGSRATEYWNAPTLDPLPPQLPGGWPPRPSLAANSALFSQVPPPASQVQVPTFINDAANVRTFDGMDWSIDWERVPPPSGVVLPNDEDDQVREEEQENGHGEVA